MGEIKQNNFRVDQDTADQFRQFCEANGLSQAQGFDHLMAVLEMNKAKEAIPERLTEMEEFELHSKALVNAYLQSLEYSTNAENRAKEQFAAALSSKDKTIADLQARLERAQEEKDAAEQARDDADKAVQEAEKQVKAVRAERDSARNSAEDKQQVNIVLSEKLASQEEKIKDYSRIAAQAEKYRSESTNLAAQLKEAQRTIQDKEKDLATAAKQAELEKKLAVQEAVMENQKMIATLEERVRRLQEQLDEKEAQVQEDAVPQADDPENE